MTKLGKKQPNPLEEIFFNHDYDGLKEKRLLCI